MERVLTCEACGGKIAISPAQAGQEVKCSSCGAGNQVPTLRGLSSLPLAADSQTKTHVDTWGWRGPITAICLAGLLFSAYYTVRHTYFWSQLKTDYNTERHIADDAAVFDEVNLDMTLNLWDRYSNISLGKKRPDDYKIMNDLAAQSLQSAIIGGVFIVLLAVATIITIRSAKRAQA